VIDGVFPHVGESILERIINQDPSYVLEQLDLLQKNGFVGVQRQVPIVFPNAAVMFDGFSAIDLALLFDDDTIFPIEVKLGYKGLTRASMDKKLAPCTVSRHKNETRIKGNILAVLNRYFDPELDDLISSDSLHARVNNQHFVVTPEWGIIARNCVLASWSNSPPKFNGRQRALSLEGLCSAYGRDAFNKLVKDMLSDVDYFGQWVGIDA